MCTCEKLLERFERRLSEVSESSGHVHSFNDICTSAGVSPADIEEILLEELGEDGEGIVNLYFGNVGHYFGNKSKFY